MAAMADISPVSFLGTKEPQPMTESARAIRIIQEALGHFVNSLTPSPGIDPRRPFEAIVDGMLIRVTHSGWLVCDVPRGAVVPKPGPQEPPEPVPANLQGSPFSSAL
jgi:hypothetical protein